MAKAGTNIRSHGAPAQHKRVAYAALNNAHWCAAMCRAHGGRSHFSASLWQCDHKMPMFYPSAVSLGHSAQAQTEIRRKLAAAHLSAGSAVKDSFAALDLTGLGFAPLFDATWLWRAGDFVRDADRSDLQWSEVEGETELHQWQNAWHPEPLETAIFVPALLAQEDHTILAGRRNEQIVAGCVASHSGGVVGLSNWFGDSEVLAECLAAIAALHPGLPIVGYESGEPLAQFTAQGFNPIGPLRVWLKN